MTSSGTAVAIDADGVRLEGHLVMPEGACGIVAFAHGSGSSRRSPRNRLVAARLQQAQLATLLFDLLEPGEEEIDMRTAELRFDIPLLSRRLIAAVDWLSRQQATSELALGCFGASTGAAAALVAAAQRPERVRAVVSRGGRPDLAGEELERVRAPTLLIVGGDDPVVIDLNRKARARMRSETRLEIIPGASHLFEEPGTLDKVADLAAEWFGRRLLMKERA